jgi:hypothetical protein
MCESIYNFSHYLWQNIVHKTVRPILYYFTQLYHHNHNTTMNIVAKLYVAFLGLLLLRSTVWTADLPVSLSAYTIIYSIIRFNQVYRVPVDTAQPSPSPNSIYLTASASENYIIVGDSLNMRILKRSEANGVFHNIWFQPSPCNAVATDGVWFVCANSTNLNIFTFNETTSKFDIFLSYPEVYYSTQFLSDGTLVTLSMNTVVTYVNVGDTWEVAVNSSTAINAVRVSPGGILMHLTDTTLVYMRATTAVLMQRNMEDYSWTLLEEVDLTVAQATQLRIMWLNDTLMATYATYGAVDNYLTMVRVYVKANDVWNVTLDTYGAGLIEPEGGLGLELLPVSETQVFVAAPLAGHLTRGFIGCGSVLLLERGTDSQWRFTTSIENVARDRVWGASVIKTKQELLVWTCHVTQVLSGTAQARDESLCGFAPIPYCFKDPIDVTCVNQQLDSCAGFTNLNMDELYTLQNPGCGITKESHVSFSNHGLEVSFEFSRFGVQKASCNATLTCPRVPATQNSPNSANVPVRTPADSSNVSAAVSLASLSTITLAAIAIVTM